MKILFNRFEDTVPKNPVRKVKFLAEDNEQMRVLTSDEEKLCTAAIYSPANGATPIGDATAIVSEILHLAGSKKQYSDKDLADVAHKSKYAADVPKYVPSALNVYNLPESQRTPDGYSIYFHYLQYNICNTSPGSSHGIR